MADAKRCIAASKPGAASIESFPVAETFHDWGMYSQVLWGFKKGWVAGVRGDYLHMQDSALHR